MPVTSGRSALRPPDHPHRRSPAWRLGLAGLAGVGVSFGFARYGYGLFLPEIRDEFGMSVSLVGLVGSASYVGYLGALVLVGLLSSRVGPRVLVVIGGSSAAVGTALVGLAPGVGVLTVGLVMAGTSPGWIWAPYSDAVDRMVPADARARVLALIPSGTAFGVAVAGPVAMVAHGSAWRYAWLVFAAGSAVATVLNARVLPAGPPQRTGGSSVGPPLRWFVRRAAMPLYVTAVSYGVVGAVYWLLAVEAVTAGAGTGGVVRAVFWTLMGVAGTAGVATGAVFVRFGLRWAHRALFAALAVAVALLGVLAHVPVAVGVSAVVYGPAFMAGSALLAVWSYRVFPERPTTGFSATVFFLGVGTVLGPAVVGGVAERYGVSVALLGTALVAASTLLVAPPVSTGASVPT
ncbi:putative MFS family arabinose efflux permease [Haloactinopolyspora alba]|uniref:Putative MFS family arabinose efflux permease n=1 Tax=Haloactinopolyspora alba TaxID=648780 RepID=A0A2P8EBN4_9ACTN|nr:YbfB/YjiJ family MFS transporter [Haloactinopolyspora alba]PSL06876.1 putative MFS family arabinose efflux permease [Haloactinopolyspora alba]